MRLNKLLQWFSKEKYFLDSKYQNLFLETNDQIGSLAHVSKIFSELETNFSYVRSVAKNSWEKKRFGLDVSIQRVGDYQMNKLIERLTLERIKFQFTKPITMPWFPRKLQDINLIGGTRLKINDILNNDHIYFSDQQYRKRRQAITDISKQYRMGQEIPQVQYTPEQQQLWKVIYKKVRESHSGIASKRFINNLDKVQQDLNLQYGIPQLNNVHKYLYHKTKYIVKPTYGILSQREFLNALAFRVFCCTQYLRHTSTPFYTPQPDLVHEIIGHVPMFIDLQVADLSQQIGLMSLGASDQKIHELGNLYLYTIQFGVQRENNANKFYGAGIASSVQQIEHFKSDNAKFIQFNPAYDAKDTVPIQTVQNMYRVADNMEQMSKKLEQFGKTIYKPITTFYNFSTNTIEYDRCIQAVDLGDKGTMF